MIKKEKQEYIREALNRMDDNGIDRAYFTFGHMTQEQLDQPYGKSGKTNREIAFEYYDYYLNYLEASDYLEELFNKDGNY